VVSGAAQSNRGFSTAQSVTVSGLNFNTVDTTVTVLIALNGCGTASWTSGTSVVCLQSSSGTPADSSMVATVAAAFVSTAVSAFTFDGILCFLVKK